MAKKKQYQDLDQGDLVYIELDPTRGHEQRGKQPCIVLTKNNKFMNYMIGIAPISSVSKLFPLHISLPDNLLIKGQVLLEHHRMIDIESRGFSYVETVSQELIDECISKLKLLY